MASLLAPNEMALLKRLEMVHRQPARGLYPGQRRSSRTARSAEFSDFRPYSPGDDIRQIDWRAFARLEKLMLRLYVAEEEAALNVVLDASDSMAVGTPPKWPAAQKLAAAVAMLGLSAMDRVAVGVLDGTGRSTPHLRMPGGAGRALAFLRGIEPAGRAGPDELARLRWLRPGITVVISDFLVEAEWSGALTVLGRNHQEPLLWQVLAPDEEHPRISGDLRLVDVESGQVREMTITSRVIREYVKALSEHREELRRQASASGGRFLNTRSDESLEATMVAALAAGVVRRS